MPIYVMKFIPYMYLALFVEHVVAQNDMKPSQNKQLYVDVLHAAAKWCTKLR